MDSPNKPLNIFVFKQFKECSESIANYQSLFKITIQHTMVCTSKVIKTPLLGTIMAKELKSTWTELLYLSYDKRYKAVPDWLSTITDCNSQPVLTVRYAGLNNDLFKTYLAFIQDKYIYKLIYPSRIPADNYLMCSITKQRKRKQLDLKLLTKNI